MIGAVRNYLLQLAAGAFLTSLVLALIPRGPARRIAAVVCGMVMLILTLSPLAAIDTDALAGAISVLEMQKEQTRTGIEIRNKALVAEIISARTASYILDKAASIGMAIEVSVEMDQSGATPFPCGVTFSGDATAMQRQALARYVDETFAVPEERQVWTP